MRLGLTFVRGLLNPNRLSLQSSYPEMMIMRGWLGLVLAPDLLMRCFFIFSLVIGAYFDEAPSVPIQPSIDMYLSA